MDEHEKKAFCKIIDEFAKLNAKLDELGRKVDAMGNVEVIIGDHPLNDVVVKSVREAVAKKPITEWREASIKLWYRADVLVPGGETFDEPETVQDLIDAIDGRANFCGRIKLEIVDKGKPDNAALKLLSKRERQIAKWVIRSVKTKKIAQQLDISAHTVANHIKNMRRKLGVNSRSQLVCRLAGLPFE